MNIKKDKEGRIEVYCDCCCQELERGDLLIINDAVLCLYCKNHLGYIWDLKEEK